MAVVGKWKLPRTIEGRSLLSAADNSETTQMNIEISKKKEEFFRIFRGPNIN